jgi:hypothetical protein
VAWKEEPLKEVAEEVVEVLELNNDSLNQYHVLRLEKIERLFLNWVPYHSL